MIRELLNTLYIQTQGAYAHIKDGNVCVEVEQEVKLRVPIHHLGSIVTFGIVTLSGPLMQQFAVDGRSVVMLDEHGRFRARVTGRTSGNVLLRKDQWLAHLNERQSLEIAKRFVAAKLQNSRQVLMRGARDYSSTVCKSAVVVHESALDLLADLQDMDLVRGEEGLAAQHYFDAFPDLIRVPGKDFAFNGRNRRPPRDRVNALISFLYSIGTSDCAAALEAVGLDPQCGFLHVLRPGRPALALDLIEEFRAIFYDRLALTMINRRELVAKDFDKFEGGAWGLNNEGRKKVFMAYQMRKKEEIHHPMLKAKVPIGLVPHLQARLLARYLRGDIPNYPPFMI